jgi:uncharacterized membrane protein (DUF485 family)
VVVPAEIGVIVTLPLLLPQLGLISKAEKVTSGVTLTNLEAVAVQLLASVIVTVYVVFVNGETELTAVFVPLLQA